ncbi:MAG: hypothetical protein IJW96_05360 [Clostridia bacterium]|nr:hypothetical protein [Clostridia bacterium]
MNTEEVRLNEETLAKQQEREDARIAAEVEADYAKRREERRSVENSWVLNMNFLCGNQYCDVSPLGGLVEEDEQFYWQSRRVFNHIAPTIDSRISKLENRKPELTVRAFSDEDGDLKAAKLATGILRYVQDRIGFHELSSRATMWSETCGSAFFKVGWDERGGRQVGVDIDNRPVYEGEVQVSVVPPFEIFPDRLDADDFDGIRSLIHARVVPVDYIMEKFGVAIPGREISGIMSYSESTTAKLPNEQTGMNFTSCENAEVLIERYTRPTMDAPEGKLEIVAGGKLLFSGVLPFVNGERNVRGFPFVKQDCMRLPGAFFGCSVIERLIPVQRAYNAVRNRKHEFLNRLSMGVLTVEDGSIDTDELSEEGLLPGKVLVYRQGGKPPELLDCGGVPNEFKDEEEWLEKEFAMISGVSDLSQNSTPARVTSATGLQLLLSQDESRMTGTIMSIDRALKEVGRQILRLYRQFAGTARLMTLTGEDKKTQVYYFNAASLDVNDLQFEAKESVTPAEKKATLLNLYHAGLLTDSEGKLTAENKHRILEAFGFGSYESARDISFLHASKAGEENLEIREKDILPDVYDDHKIHIHEHTRFLLSAEFKRYKNKEEAKAKFIAHMNEHKKMLAEQESAME